MEVMKIMGPPSKVPMMHCSTQCPRPCSRPPLTHASARASWTLMGSLDQSLVGSLLLSLGSWCAQGSVCAFQESVSPVLCKFWRLSGGVNGDLLQEDLCHIHTQRPCPCGRLLPTLPPQEMLKHSSVSVSVGSLGSGVHKFC